MSKPLPKEEYNKKIWNRAMNWIMGRKDPYMGNMESPEKEKEEALSLHHLYHDEEMEVIEHVQDTKHNPIYKSFFYIYRILAVVCCITLIVLLLYTVSYLPPVGDSGNPAHNEVVDKYVKYRYEIKWLLNYSILRTASSVGLCIPLDFKSYTNQLMQHS